MNETQGVTNLGDGKYSFFVGKQRYTLVTPLGEERLARIVSNVQALVASFPPKLSQDERLFLALMLLANKFDETETRLDLLEQAAARKDEID